MRSILITAFLLSICYAASAQVTKVDDDTISVPSKKYIDVPHIDYKISTLQSAIEQAKSQIEICNTTLPAVIEAKETEKAELLVIRQAVLDLIDNKDTSSVNWTDVDTKIGG